MDGQDDVRALLLVYHHPVNGVLLAEQQEGGRSWMGQKNEGVEKGYTLGIVMFKNDNYNS